MLNNNNNLNMQTGRLSENKGIYQCQQMFLNTILVMKSL